MISRSRYEGTASSMPTGEYQSLDETQLNKSKPPESTYANAVRVTNGKRLRLENFKADRKEPATFVINIEEENRKAKFARLNERLRKL